MTRLLIVSDSHGNINKLDDILRKHQGKHDILIHLGDRCYDILSIKDDIENTILIRGNIETTSGSASDVGSYEEILEIEGLKIMATHGHRYSVHSTLVFLKKEAVKKGVALVLFGHTHEKHLEIDGDIMYFNPGAVIENDYGIIDVDNGEIVSIEHGYLSDRW